MTDENTVERVARAIYFSGDERSEDVKLSVWLAAPESVREYSRSNARAALAELSSTMKGQDDE